jgi:hypothetical protein
MIARIFPRAQSFKKVCRYVCEDLTRAKVLYQEGVRGHDYRLMARDFEMIHGLHSGIGKPVFHGVLDFHRDERLDDGRMAEIGRKFLPEVGIIDTQCAIVKHLDTDHRHLHLVANRVDFSGHPIDNFPERLRSIEAVEKLVREYDLVPMGRKNLRLINFDGLGASETRKYAIYRSITEYLPGCRDLEELEQRLLRLGIETRYRTDQQTGQKIGISFRYQNEAFKGKEIDRDFTMGRLEHTLAMRQELTQWEQQKLALRKEQELTLRKEQERVPQEKLAPAIEETLSEELKQEQEMILEHNERLTHRYSHHLSI